VVEHLPYNHEVLSSNPSSAKTNKKCQMSGVPVPTEKGKPQDLKNEEEASFELCQTGNEDVGLPVFANCSLHGDACFPNALSATTFSA
jgi:hypothetical protein